MRTCSAAVLAALSISACASGPPPRPVSVDPANPDAPVLAIQRASTALDPEIPSRGPTAKASSGKQKDAEPASAALYTCPMHPEVVQDAAGRCPKCSMDLVPEAPKGDSSGKQPPDAHHPGSHGGGMP
jgi:hypothetical protein